MKARLIVVGLIAFGVFVAVLAAPAKRQTSTSDLMQKKLEFSQNILEGLALEDFEKITNNAKAMNGLTQIEAFFVADTADYRAQLKIFRFANDELVRLADEESIDGAALAYMQQTLSCVNCHKYLRSH